VATRDHLAGTGLVRRRAAMPVAPGSAAVAVAAPIEHEQVVIRRGPRSGLYTIVAVHSTALGPALGGCRLWRYSDVAAGLRDALRLSRAMTLKAAAAGLDLGGGKGVICRQSDTPPAGPVRRAVLADFAETVEGLGGSYVTAEDVGTGTSDMIVIAETTDHVTGLPVERGGSGDPSPFTAHGVEAAMRASCAHAFGSPELAGRRVAIVGVGRVGACLARRLEAAGAELVLSDIDERRRMLAAELPRARWVDPATALAADVEVLAPCALGGILEEAIVPRLRCAVVCGAANNQLAHDAVADELAARGILYAPDFIANAGGLIHVSAELTGDDPASVKARIVRLEDDMGAILDEAAAAGTTPLAAARQRARRRLERVVR
jgi:leucine dehydrogenase